VIYRVSSTGIKANGGISLTIMASLATSALTAIARSHMTVTISPDNPRNIY